MDTCTLRDFQETDSDWLLEWYRADQAGMADLLGVDVSDETKFMAACNALFEATLQHHARLWMVERATQPLGFFLMTNFDPTTHSARVHIYVDPDQRRYSFQAAQSIGDTVIKTLKDVGVEQLYATQPRAHRGAYAVAKRMGFHELPTVMLVKELN